MHLHCPENMLVCTSSYVFAANSFLFFFSVTMISEKGGPSLFPSRKRVRFPNVPYFIRFPSSVIVGSTTAGRCFYLTCLLNMNPMSLLQVANIAAQYTYDYHKLSWLQC